MLDRLLNLVLRLKNIFLKIEEREAHGNATEMSALNEELTVLKKEHTDAMQALDELEEVIKKWES